MGSLRRGRARLDGFPPFEAKIKIIDYQIEVKKFFY
jgi:hypothetical protein